MRNILLLATTLLCVGIFGQEVAKNALFDIEQHAYQKKFTKKWEKSKQTDWEKGVESATSIEELNQLFNEFSDLFAQTTSFSMGNSTATTEVEFVEYMMEVEGVLGEDFVRDWSADQRKEWRGDMEKFLVTEKEKKKKEDQMARFQKMTSIVKDFTNKFPQIWEDSKENAFKNSTDVSLKGGTEITISKDDYGVASFTVFYDTEGDEQMAKKLLDELIDVVESNVGEGYKQGNDMDPEYTGSMRKNYQFEGEKFAETAKKPTVAIGTLKDTAGVRVVITEPVFGH